jgi:hypothetical protein
MNNDRSAICFRLGQLKRERGAFVVVGFCGPLRKAGQQLHDIERRQLLRRESLARERVLDELLEILDGRFASKWGVIHTARLNSTPYGGVVQGAFRRALTVLRAIVQ